MQCATKTHVQPTICCAQHRTSNVRPWESTRTKTAMMMQCLRNKKELDYELAIEKKLAVYIPKLKALVATLEAKVVSLREERKRSSVELEGPTTKEPTTTEESSDYVFVGLHHH
jgi:hypothetical protein